MLKVYSLIPECLKLEKEAEGSNWGLFHYQVWNNQIDFEFNYGQRLVKWLWNGGVGGGSVTLEGVGHAVVNGFPFPRQMVTTMAELIINEIGNCVLIYANIAWVRVKYDVGRHLHKIGYYMF